MEQKTLHPYSGPLDVLLTEILAKKRNITEVALSEVTKNYLAYIEAHEGEIPPEELADFLVIATRLLLIKSRSLLPASEEEDDEQELSLEDQLKLYHAFAQASKKIEELWTQGSSSYRRVQKPLVHNFDPLSDDIDLTALHEAMEAVVKRLTPKDRPLEKKRITRIISLKQKIQRLQDLFKKRKKCSFYDIIDGDGSREDIVVSFLAMLELVKSKEIVVTQDAAFGEIQLKKYE